MSSTSPWCFYGCIGELYLHPQLPPLAFPFLTTWKLVAFIHIFAFWNLEERNWSSIQYGQCHNAIRVCTCMSQSVSLPTSSNIEIVQWTVFHLRRRASQHCSSTSRPPGHNKDCGIKIKKTLTIKHLNVSWAHLKKTLKRIRLCHQNTSGPSKYYNLNI